MALPAGFYGGTPPSPIIYDDQYSDRYASINSTINPARTPIPMTATAQMMERQREQDMFSKFMEDVKQVIQKPIVDLHKEVKDLRDELAAVKDQIMDCCSQELKEKRCPSRLPKALTGAVKKLHLNLENQFDGSKMYSDKRNTEVAKMLKTMLNEEFGDGYSQAIIQRAVYRHYESRRRIHNDHQPSRESARLENEKRTKIRNRQRQLYNRRLKCCKDKEKKFWLEIDERFMSEEESDEENPQIFIQHKPNWRSNGLDKIIQKLDKRAMSKKHPMKKRINGAQLASSTAPPNAPTWSYCQIQNGSTDVVANEETQSEHLSMVEEDDVPCMSTTQHLTNNGESSQQFEEESRLALAAVSHSRLNKTLSTGRSGSNCRRPSDAHGMDSTVARQQNTEDTPVRARVPARVSRLLLDDTSDSSSSS